MHSKDNGYIQAIKQLSQTINSDILPKKALASIVRTTAKVMQAAGCAVMTLSHQKQHLSIIAAHGLSDQYLRKGILNVRKSLPEIMEGKISTVPDITHDKRTQYPEAAQMENITSIVGAPIFGSSGIIGEIRVYFQERRQFNSVEKDVLAIISSFTAIVLEKIEPNQGIKVDGANILSDKIEGNALTKTTGSHFTTLKPLNFSHESEEEFAKLLDFYQIEWLYEPRSFPLTWQDKRVTEMFTPDFYLPEIGLYIELTTLKQSLITEKNRKLRLVKQLYPEINIRLLNKKDYHRLLAKYGHGPLGTSKVAGVGRVLLTHTRIQRRIGALAKQISKDYSGQHLVLVGVLKGVICFLSDIMQGISLPVTVELMGISYFGTDSGKTVKITKDVDIDIAGCNVLMVEDIVDTGMTLNYVLNHLASYKPASLRVCTLLDKKVRRLVNVPLQYVGFEIPDEFVVGYGLDYQGEYRNLPFISVLNPEISAPK